ILLLQRRVELKELNSILYVFSLSAVFFSLLTLLIAVFTVGFIPANQELAGMIGMHASYMGMYIAFAFFILLGISLKQGFNLLNSILLIFLLLMIAILASRIIAVASVIIAFIWFGFLNYKLKYLLRLIGAIVVVTLLSIFSPPIKNRFYEAVNFEDKVILDQEMVEEGPEFRNSYGGRTLRSAIWKCSLDILGEHWLFGVGTGDDHAALQQSYKNRNFVFAWKYNSHNAHNLFLQSLIAAGVLSLLALILIFYYIIHFALKFKMLDLFSFSVLFFLFYMIDISISIHKVIVIFSLFSSVFAS